MFRGSGLLPLRRRVLGEPETQRCYRGLGWRQWLIGIVSQFFRDRNRSVVCSGRIAGLQLRVRLLFQGECI